MIGVNSNELPYLHGFAVLTTGTNTTVAICPVKLMNNEEKKINNDVLFNLNDIYNIT